MTVVLAVHNTMPDLTECLDSLLAQTIGLGRLQIVAVDDGSTDGGGEELDRLARAHPDTVTVLHQPDSGGPAAPSNRGLERARGRYVHFMGADDRLGEEALARLVAHADALGSDIVIGRMTGVGGRYVHQGLFRRSDPDITLHGSALPFTLSNAKLFRRELVERHRLRFPEDLPVGSDQPFTIEACVRAGRISVLADYTYYYAVRRRDAGDITHRAGHLERLRCTARIMHHAAGLIGPGPERDSLLHRHFTWELAKLLQPDFPDLGEPVRRELCAGIAELADAYLTEPLRDSLPVRRRALLALAQRGAVDLLVRAIEDAAAHGPLFLLEGDRAYLRCPGFRDPALNLPDRVFEVLDEPLTAVLCAGTELLAADWDQRGDDLALSLTVRTPLTGDTSATVVRLMRGSLPRSADRAGGRRLPEPDTLPPAAGDFERGGGDGTVIHARIPVAAATASLGVRVHARVAGRTYEIPLRARGKPMPLARRWRLEDSYRAAARVSGKGRMTVRTGPVDPPRERRWPARLRRALRFRPPPTRTGAAREGK
ncbi:glycosyltransferase family 2 protein [Streptomyces sp. NPDC001985]|uniref:glycosyltransferase family 2 protein n=1 Tax=Streptomyces sp. NPDC001985 TaxID=3154406 RepID=UPI00331F169C